MFVVEYLKKTILSIDYFIVAIVCTLAIFGIVVISSITGGNSNLNLTTQQQFAFVSGLFLFFVFSVIDYKFITKFYWFIYVLNIGLIIAVIFFGTPTAIGGAMRDIRLPFLGGFGIQPSQYAKIFMIIFLATFIEKYNEKINNPIILLLISALIALPTILIFRQPSLSASMVIMLISVTMVFLGGLSYKIILTALSAIVPTLVLVYLDLSRGYDNYIFIDRIVQPFHIRRLTQFFDDSLHFQTYQSQRALGSGQLTGQGFNSGIISQAGNLPEAHNDFIFAVIGEEFGFIGANIVLFVMFILIIKCILVAVKADTLRGKLIASGVASMLFYQTFIHVGVVTDILPNTGITLPFVSYGGTSMWMLMISMGIVMNIHINKVNKIL